MPKYLDDTGLSHFKAKNDAKYQDKLTSGTNIKSINNSSILGSGNLTTPNTKYYQHEFELEVTGGKVLIKVITSQSYAYTDCEECEWQIRKNVFLLYQTQSDMFKPIFIDYFSGEYAYFEYYECINAFQDPRTLSITNNKINDTVTEL